MAENQIVQKKINIYYMSGVDSSFYSVKEVNACRLAGLVRGIRGNVVLVVDKGRVFSIGEYRDYKNLIPVYHLFIVYFPANQRNKGLATIIQLATMFSSFYLMDYMGGLNWVKSLSSAGQFFVKGMAGMLLSYGGGLLYNSFVPLPEDQVKPDLTPNATYEINYRKNYFKTGSPIPDLYGVLRVYPYHAMTPYSEYLNNQKYFNLLFLVSHGRCQFEDVRFGDIPLTSSLFGDYQGVPDIQIQYIYPHEQLHLFRDNVYLNNSVASCKLEYGREFGPFKTCSKVETIVAIAVDLTFPNGICEINATFGSAFQRTVQVDIKYRKIDEEDIPIDDWQIKSFSFTNDVYHQLSYTLKIDVPDGRYEVSFENKSVYDQYKRGMCIVQSLKGLKDSKRTYGDKTLIAVRCRSIEGIELDRFNVKACRYLKHWDDNEKTWSENYARSCVMWSAVNLLMYYNDDIQESDIDWNTFYPLQSAYYSTRKGFCGYNAYLTESNDLLSALSDCLRVARIFYYVIGNKISFVRDEPIDYVSAVFSADNIKSWTEEIGYTTNDLAKAVNVSYFDSKIDVKDSVLCEPDIISEIETGTIPTIEISGVTDREHAWREGKYHIESSLKRRHYLTIVTDREGYIPIFHSRVKVFIDMPKGEITLRNVQYRGFYLRIDHNFDSADLTLFFIEGDEYSIFQFDSDSVGSSSFIGDFFLGSDAFHIDGHDIYLREALDRSFLAESSQTNGYIFLRKSDGVHHVYAFEAYSDIFYIDRSFDGPYSHLFLRTMRGNLTPAANDSAIVGGSIVNVNQLIDDDIRCILFSNELEAYEEDFQVIKIRGVGNDIELSLVNYVGIVDTGTMPERPVYTSVPLTVVEYYSPYSEDRSYEGLYNENSFYYRYPNNDSWQIVNKGVVKIRIKVHLHFYFYYLRLTTYQDGGKPGDPYWEKKTVYNAYYTGYSFNLILGIRSNGVWSEEVQFIENRDIDSEFSTEDSSELWGSRPHPKVIAIESDTYIDEIDSYYIKVEIPDSNALPTYPSYGNEGENVFLFEKSYMEDYLKEEDAK